MTTTRHGASYQVIVLSPDKPPMIGTTVSTKNIEKAIKLAFLPYNGKLKSQNCIDGNQETIGQIFYRQTNDEFYDSNITASKLTVSQNTIKGQAIVTALTKTKTRDGTLTSEAITHIINTYNGLHGIPPIPIPLARSRGGPRKGSGSKRPHKAKTAFEYFVREQAKMNPDTTSTKETLEANFDALGDKSVYLKKETDDKARYDSEMLAWEAKQKNDIKRPVGGRNPYILWQSAHPKNGVIDKETYAKMWEQEKKDNPDKWSKLAQQDKERAERELAEYDKKMKAFTKFQANASPLPSLGKRQREEEPKNGKKMKKEEVDEVETEEDSSSSESEEDEEDVNVK